MLHGQLQEAEAQRVLERAKRRQGGGSKPRIACQAAHDLTAQRLPRSPPATRAPSSSPISASGSRQRQRPARPPRRSGIGWRPSTAVAAAGQPASLPPPPAAGDGAVSPREHPDRRAKGSGCGGAGGAAGALRTDRREADETGGRARGSAFRKGTRCTSASSRCTPPCCRSRRLRRHAHPRLGARSCRDGPGGRHVLAEDSQVRCEQAVRQYEAEAAGEQERAPPRPSGRNRHGRASKRSPNGSRRRLHGGSRRGSQLRARRR